MKARPWCISVLVVFLLLLALSCSKRTNRVDGQSRKSNPSLLSEVPAQNPPNTNKAESLAGSSDNPPGGDGGDSMGGGFGSSKWDDPDLALEEWLHPDGGTYTIYARRALVQFQYQFQRTDPSSGLAPVTPISFPGHLDSLANDSAINAFLSSTGAEKLLEFSEVRGILVRLPPGVSFDDAFRNWMNQFPEIIRVTPDFPVQIPSYPPYDPDPPWPPPGEDTRHRSPYFPEPGHEWNQWAYDPSLNDKARSPSWWDRDRDVDAQGSLVWGDDNAPIPGFHEGGWDSLPSGPFKFYVAQIGTGIAPHNDLIYNQTGHQGIPTEIGAEVYLGPNNRPALRFGNYYDYGIGQPVMDSRWLDAAWGAGEPNSGWCHDTRVAGILAAMHRNYLPDAQPEHGSISGATRDYWEVIAAGEPGNRYHRIFPVAIEMKLVDPPGEDPPSVEYISFSAMVLSVRAVGMAFGLFDSSGYSDVPDYHGTDETGAPNGRIKVLLPELQYPLPLEFNSLTAPSVEMAQPAIMRAYFYMIAGRPETQDNAWIAVTVPGGNYNAAEGYALGEYRRLRGHQEDPNYFGILTVGAYTKAGKRWINAAPVPGAVASNYGSLLSKVAAPGAEICGTYYWADFDGDKNFIAYSDLNLVGWSNNQPGLKYWVASGTSFSAPFAAGLALLLSVDASPWVQLQKVNKAIFMGAEDLYDTTGAQDLNMPKKISFTAAQRWHRENNWP